MTSKGEQMCSETHQTAAKHVPPSMGQTVDEVLRRFIRESDDWSGIYVYEAQIVVTKAGPARMYRVQGYASSRGKSRIGVAELGGLCIRDATPAEEEELEDAVGIGFVQIIRMRRGKAAEIVHQATGRALVNQQDR